MSLNRPVRLVNDFDPFNSIHRRVERHLQPALRHGRNGLYVLGAITGSILFTLLIRKPLPKTINAEWKDAEVERDRLNMTQPMKTHRVGDAVTIPAEFTSRVGSHPNTEKRELP